MVLPSGGLRLGPGSQQHPADAESTTLIDGRTPNGWRDPVVLPSAAQLGGIGRFADGMSEGEVWTEKVCGVLPVNDVRFYQDGAGPEYRKSLEIEELELAAFAIANNGGARRGDAAQLTDRAGATHLDLVGHCIAGRKSQDCVSAVLIRLEGYDGGGRTAHCKPHGIVSLAGTNVDDGFGAR